MVEVGGIVLLSEVSLLGLLHVVRPALALGKADGLLLGVELHDGTLHVITAQLVSHQVVLPSVFLAQHIPVQLPEVSVVVTRLCGRLGFLVDSDGSQGDQILRCTRDNLVLFYGGLIDNNGLLSDDSGGTELTCRGPEQVSGQHSMGAECSHFTIGFFWLVERSCGCQLQVVH